MPGVDPVLERVLHQGDEQERRHLHRLGRSLELLLNGRQLVAPEGHQVDVIVHELDLRRELDLLRLAVVQRIPQQVAQLADALLRLVRVDLRQGRDVVQGIEQEMRVELMLEPGQFGLGRLAALFLELHLPVVHPHQVTESHRKQDHQHLEEDGGDDPAQEEGPDVPHPNLVHHFLRDLQRSPGDEPVQVVAHQQQYIEDVEPFHLPLPTIQELRDEQIVVQAVQEEQREHHPRGVAEHEEGLLHMAGRRPGDEGRNEKNTSPDDDLGGVQDEISAPEILHIANIIRFLDKLEMTGTYCIIIEPMLSAVVVLFSWSSFWMVREARLAE